jgi:hypothetical protein
MKREKLALLSFLFFLPLAILTVIVMPRTPSEFETKFEKVMLGMNRQEIEGLLGKPDKESREFHLGQYNGFEEEYEKAKKSNAAYYLFWNRDIDFVYVVGMDSKGNAVFKSYGGT